MYRPGLPTDGFTFEVDWTRNGYTSPDSLIENWSQIRFAAGSNIEEGWPEITPARGSVTLTDDSILSSVTRNNYLQPRPFRCMYRGLLQFAGIIEPLEPLQNGRPDLGLQAKLRSKNGREFGRQVEWSNLDPTLAEDVFRALLSRRQLDAGSVVGPHQDIGLASFQGTSRALLSQLGRVAGCVVAEDRQGNIDFTHIGRALSLELFSDTITTDNIVFESGAVAYRRDPKTVSSIGYIVGLQAGLEVITSINEDIAPGEEVIIRAEADPGSLIDALWVDLSPTEGMRFTTISRGPFTLVVQAENVTGNTISLVEFPVFGTPIRSNQVTVDRVELPDFRVRGRLAFDIEPWYVPGEEQFGRFLLSQYADGLAWASLPLALNAEDGAASRMGPGRVFNTDLPSLNPPTNSWLAHKCEWDITKGDIPQVLVEAVGLPAGSNRWGRGRWGEATWQ